MSEETKELVAVDSVPKMEISLTENKHRLEQMRQFISTQMDKGIDYGTIPGCGSKEVLLKSGAEKMENIFGLYHELTCVDKVTDWEKGFFYFQYKCVVKSKKTGVKQAEALGSCNSKEKGKASQDAFNIVNTVDKIAQKRAIVAAVINATALSYKFTQDLEDFEEPERIVGKPEVKKDSAGAVMSCVSCGKEVTEKVAKYSSDKFSGKVLCFECQKMVREANN